MTQDSLTQDSLTRDSLNFQAKLWDTLGTPVFVTLAAAELSASKTGKFRVAPQLWDFYNSWKFRVEPYDLTASFAEFKHMPKGSLGHDFWLYCHSRGFKLPGTPNAVPVHSVPHDLAHVLGGYDPDDVGEVLVTAFTAGFVEAGEIRAKAKKESRTDHKLNFMARATYTTRLPGDTLPAVLRYLEWIVSSQQKIFDGRVSKPEIEAAWRRGLAMTVDLFHDWNYLEDAPRQTKELRRQFNILPVTSGAAGS